MSRDVLHPDLLPALIRLERAASNVAAVLDGGLRDPKWSESQELEEAALAYGRVVNRLAAEDAA